MDYKLKQPARCTRFIILLFTLMSMANLTACSESDCSLEGESAVRFTFVNSRTNAPVTLFDSLTVTTVGTDSVLVNRERQIDHLSLPLSYTSSNTDYILHYNRFLRDTIHLTHKNTPYFISADCGIRMFYQLTSVNYTQILIDSIRLVNPEINDHEKENYRIYYTPDE